ncbi:MAG TPA: Hsp20/alpha crystallin family protein [Thermoplasmata archaeon]|nr:Hsp20/alpha crystallin family protein [Thermoplasmata archaeon]
MNDPLAVPTPSPAPKTAAPTDPFAEMDRLLSEFRDDWFSTFGPGIAPRFVLRSTGSEPAFRPALSDVEDTGAAYQIRADLPGVAKDQIAVRVHGDVVEFEGEAQSASEEPSKNFLRRERIYRGFHRAVRLPEPVVGEKVEARFENGTLTISVPKAHPETERTVPVA